MRTRDAPTRTKPARARSQRAVGRVLRRARSDNTSRYRRRQSRSRPIEHLLLIAHRVNMDPRAFPYAGFAVGQWPPHHGFIEPVKRRDAASPVRNGHRLFVSGVPDPAARFEMELTNGDCFHVHIVTHRGSSRNAYGP